MPQPSPAPRAPPTSSLSIRTAHCAALPSSSSDLDLTPHGSAHTQGHQRRIARFNPHPLAERLEVGMRGLVLPFLAAAHARQSGDQIAQLFTAKCHSVDGQSEALRFASDCVY